MLWDTHQEYVGVFLFLCTKGIAEFQSYTICEGSPYRKLPGWGNLIWMKFVCQIFEQLTFLFSMFSHFVQAPCPSATILPRLSSSSLALSSFWRRCWRSLSVTLSTRVVMIAQSCSTFRYTVRPYERFVLQTFLRSLQLSWCLPLSTCAHFYTVLLFGVSLESL